MKKMMLVFAVNSLIANFAMASGCWSDSNCRSGQYCASIGDYGGVCTDGVRSELCWSDSGCRGGQVCRGAGNHPGICSPAEGFYKSMPPGKSQQKVISLYNTSCQEIPGELHFLTVKGSYNDQTGEYEATKDLRISLNEKAMEKCLEADFCVEETSIKTTFFFHTWRRILHGSMKAVVNCLK